MPEQKLRLEYVRAGDLAENPANWRLHPEGQKTALAAVLADPEVGWAGAMLYNERTKRLIDGHARKAVTDPEALVPVLIGSWSEEAERKILATLDPLAAMAEVDSVALASLLSLLPSDDDLAAIAREMHEHESAVATKLKQIEVKPPPRMAWVLIGIPLIRYGEISDAVEGIAGMSGVICETTYNDDESAV